MATKSYYGKIFFEWKEVLLIIAVVIIVIILYCFMPENGLTSKLHHTKQANVSYILYWKFYGWYQRYGFGRSTDEGQSLFLELKCPVNTCYITSNRDLLPIEEFDIIVFNIEKYIKPKQLSQTGSTPEVPQARSPNQNYVYFIVEPPPYYPNRTYIVNYEGYFNWTMTYRLDSDIPVPYGWVVPINASTLSQPINNRSWLEPNFEYTNEIAPTVGYRPKLVAWLVSNCHTPSKRENYVAALSKFIPVDIYGECGGLKWPKTDTNEFYNMLNNTYKFYLSFENSLCKDYLTEKVFAILQYYVVPVVYGGSGYAQVLPPHSYINVHNFESPLALANFLLNLSNDSREYLKYFWWKKYYKILRNTSQPLCRLCELSHMNVPSKTYYHIDRWWSEKTCLESCIARH